MLLKDVLFISSNTASASLVAITRLLFDSFSNRQLTKVTNNADIVNAKIAAATNSSARVNPRESFLEQTLQIIGFIILLFLPFGNKKP